MKYDHNQHLANKLTLLQLWNQLKVGKISFRKIIQIKFKPLILGRILWVKSFFIKVEKEFYISLSISTMILLVLLFHSKLVQESIGAALVLIIFVVTFSIFVYKWFNKWLGREVGNYEIVIIPFLLFYGYLNFLIKKDIGNYIVIEFNVMPDSFNEIVTYIAHLVAIQSSLIIFILPLLVNSFVRVFHSEKKIIIELAKLILTIFLFVLIAKITIPSKDTAMGSSYRYWLLKYDFANVVLCDGNHYSFPLAHRISNDEYIWHDRSCKIYGNMNENGFCIESCSNIVNTRKSLDNHIEKTKSSIDFYIKKSQN